MLNGPDDCVVGAVFRCAGTGAIAITVAKLPKGKATLRVTVPDTSTLVRSHAAKVVRVK